MPLKTYQESITVSSFDVGASGSLEAPALMRHFQEIASHHADELGVGFQHLQKEQIFWALTHLQFEIKRWPKMEEPITIETWPRDIQKLYTTRDFMIYDKTGNEIIRAISAWIMVDGVRKRPVRPAGRLENIEFYPEKEALGKFPESFNCEGKQLTELERQVVYSDLDINQHVNNTRYVEWMMDAIGFTPGKELKSLNIHFTNEFRYNETAQISIGHNNTQYFCSILHTETNKTGCEACLTFL